MSLNATKKTKNIPAGTAFPASGAATNDAEYAAQENLGKKKDDTVLFRTKIHIFKIYKHLDSFNITYNWLDFFSL